MRAHVPTLVSIMNIRLHVFNQIVLKLIDDLVIFISFFFIKSKEYIYIRSREIRQLTEVRQKFKGICINPARTYFQTVLYMRICARAIEMILEYNLYRKFEKVDTEHIQRMYLRYNLII